MAELVAPAEVAPPLEFDEALGDSAFKGGVSVFAEGLKSAEPVSAFEPAADDPLAAKEEVAPAPLPPVDALD